MPANQSDLANQYKLRVLKILAGLEGPDAETIVEEAWQGAEHSPDQLVTFNMTLAAPGVRLKVRMLVDPMFEETR